MRKMRGLVKYHLQQYFKTTKFVMPSAALLIMLYGNYSVKPADFVDCLLISGMFVFLIAVWIGVTVCDLEDTVSEQILILRVQSNRKYYFSHILFLMVISLIVSMIAIIVPLVQDLANGKQFFERSILSSDVLGGFIILFLCAYEGCALGELSHPRIVKDRKIAIIFVFLLAVLSLVRGAITERFWPMKLIFWVLPPIWEISCVFADTDYLDLDTMIMAGGILFLSSAFLTIVKIKLLEKKGF